MNYRFRIHLLSSRHQILAFMYLVLVFNVDVDSRSYKVTKHNTSFRYYEAEGGVIELLETGAPYAPHVEAKIT